MTDRRTSRRTLLAAGVATATAGACGVSDVLAALTADKKNSRFKISACDWSIGKPAQLDVFPLAAQLGLDGVEVSFRNPKAKYKFRDKAGREAYLAAAKENNVSISSLAIPILNGLPYSSSPIAVEYVQECVEILPKLFPERKKRIALLPFFGPGNIKNEPKKQQEVIRRLKAIAPAAEKARVVLGLETWLSAKDHIAILDAVGSPSVQVYYDTANMETQGYDIYKEIRELGRDRICQFHCKENKSLLGQGPINFKKVKDAIDAIGYEGWLVIESARPEGMSVDESYSHNVKYLRGVFAS
jgi:sugar phosphate isomerase/epimerase